MIISVVVLTKNGEKGIVPCIKSLLWCDEVIVVEDCLEKKTFKKMQEWEMQKCKKEKIKIYQRKLDGDFAAQRNFGLEKAKGDWVLFVDSDEMVSSELKKEIITFTQNFAIAHKCAGVYFRRKDYFLGKWLKHGETGNIKLLRLARKNAGKWQGKVHEVWFIEGETGELKNPLLHYPHPTITDFLKQINWYTDIVAQSWKEEGRMIYFWEIALFPFGKFLQNYFFRLGFLDGIAGLILALMMSFHSFLARSKLWLAIN